MKKMILFLVLAGVAGMGYGEEHLTYCTRPEYANAISVLSQKNNWCAVTYGYQAYCGQPAGVSVTLARWPLPDISTCNKDDAKKAFDVQSRFEQAKTMSDQAQNKYNQAQNQYNQAQKENKNQVSKVESALQQAQDEYNKVESALQQAQDEYNKALKPLPNQYGSAVSAVVDIVQEYIRTKQEFDRAEDAYRKAHRAPEQAHRAALEVFWAADEAYRAAEQAYWNAERSADGNKVRDVRSALERAQDEYNKALKPLSDQYGIVVYIVQEFYRAQQEVQRAQQEYNRAQQEYNRLINQR